MSCWQKLYVRDPEFEIIAGHSFDKVFEVYTEDGSAVDLQTPGVIINWSLCKYGAKDMPLLSKSTNDGGITILGGDEVNVFQVHIVHVDTSDMDGLYTMQLAITDPAGTVSQAYEADFIIRSRISNVN